MQGHSALYCREDNRSTFMYHLKISLSAFCIYFKKVEKVIICSYIKSFKIPICFYSEQKFKKLLYPHKLVARTENAINYTTMVNDDKLTLYLQ